MLLRRDQSIGGGALASGVAAARDARYPTKSHGKDVKTSRIAEISWILMDVVEKNQVDG